MLSYDDAPSWRRLALEAIDASQQITDPYSKAIMLHIAAAYGRLADRAEELADRRGTPGRRLHRLG